MVNIKTTLLCRSLGPGLRRLILGSSAIVPALLCKGESFGKETQLRGTIDLIFSLSVASLRNR